MTVLILHGSSHVGSRLTHQLSMLGNITVVTGAQGARESARLIAEFKPEVVILDAQIGDGAGIELLKKVKSFESPPTIIMTSSSPYDQYRQESLKSGADFYFQLPTEVEQLCNTVAQLSAADHRNNG